ncbi:hypothetical protein GmHk_10G027985 [Glycine max]|nr:hypothetical protein GmHk_10G027985 [Glycine max]
MSCLELYIEKDVVGGSMFHYANFVPSCGNNLSNNESEPLRNVSNLHDDDDDYLKKFKIHFGMMLCIITISIGVILMRRTFAVWRCHRVLMLGKNYMLAWILIVKMREDPSIKVSLIQERINNEFFYKVSYKKAWMAKQKAIAIEYGDWEESYAKLSSWLKHMQNHSPGSYFQILHGDFIVGNTPIIQVDDTHLYGKYRGTLLMATSQDENGGVLPLAFVVVEGETLTAWSWFLAHLREHVTNKNGICLISDCHASIKSVVANKTLG